jgi:hypothetical protein
MKLVEPVSLALALPILIVLAGNHSCPHVQVLDQEWRLLSKKFECIGMGCQFDVKRPKIASSVSKDSVKSIMREREHTTMRVTRAGKRRLTFERDLRAHR